MTNQKRPKTVRLHADDNVIVALSDLEPGSELPGEGVVCQDGVAAGHKVAVERIPKGEHVRKYGQIIGAASRDIRPGEHVHSHNMAMLDFGRDYAVGTDVRPTEYVPEGERASFEGFIRPEGQVATRNYIGVLATVACSAPAIRYIADAFSTGYLEAFENVDGVVALPHVSGCGMAAGGEGFAALQRTLAGFARHPNFGAVLMLGLGCEVNQMDAFMENTGLRTGPTLHVLNIQDAGGTRGAVDYGVGIIKDMLPEVNRVKRVPVPASHLTLGLECGGSDALSGITANPALGAAVDLLVRHGGTAILSETTEIYGAEHLLTKRAVDRDVAEKLLSFIRWWEDYTSRHGASIDNNPTPGNKAGGLTTILEKSLGAAAKGGTTNLVAVYDYAEPVTRKGFVFMNTPGYDPVSVTGMVAGGANIVCFTTGRGTIYGCKPVPVVKLATNTTMYHRMKDDMDLNCGAIADGEISVKSMGDRIFQFILDTASGKKTKSELHGIGDSEFVPWQIGAVL